MPAESPGIVIVGGSIAGLTTVQELRRGGYPGSITVVDRDHQAPYRRPDVSKSLLHDAAGKRTLLSWDKTLEATVLAPAAATSVDVAGRRVEVMTSVGDTISIDYADLVIASGAVARPSPFGPASPRVHTLRSIADADQFRLGLVDANRVVVIGGGLIGLEVAAGLTGRGKDVSVVEVERLPLQRVLGDVVAEKLVTMLRERRVKFQLGTSVTAVGGSGAESPVVRLANGCELASDLVLVSVGAQPETDWLSGTNLDLTDGVQCDEHGAVIGLPHVFAVGDVANWPNLTLGRRGRVEHWNNAIEHGVHVAKRILGQDVGDGFRSVPYFWSDQADLKLQVLGSTLGHDDVHVVREDEKSFVAEYRINGRLVAVGGVNAGREVMTRRAELVEEYSRVEPRFTTAG
jgi:3-phenylpropionate/trans-cinnamate dioxygenase ferredoxin reductase subunit